MENEKQQLEAIQDIRKMMQDSSKFLSLSGLSGVFAGVYALIGAYMGNRAITDYYLKHVSSTTNNQNSQDNNLTVLVISICLSVLLLSVLTALVFSARKAKKSNQKLFDHTSKKLFWNMVIPLAAGGIFCFALLFHGGDLLKLISPVMLIFYGLALVNSSKFTIHDIKYLGYLQITLGLIACFIPAYGLLLWAIGFGMLHIIYGSIMWFKYDRIN